jgi:hypothetical protein
MQQAATLDAADVKGLSATASHACLCSSNLAGTPTLAACTAACATPNRLIEWVTVSTNAVVDPLFHYPGLPTTFTLRGQATMRVGQ